MRKRSKGNRNSWRNLVFSPAGVVTFLLIVVGVVTAPAWGQAGASQSPATSAVQSPQAAASKLTFDVASVKRSTSDERPSSNIPLGPGGAYPRTGGLFQATSLPMVAYLAWAYDITGDQMNHLRADAPSWISAERFDIEARAQGNPTKEQMRMMVQVLLADRFKLVVHTETRQGSVYALVLSKPGKTGPQLQPHVDDGSCSAPTAPQTAPAAGQPAPAAGQPAPCDSGLRGTAGSVPGRARYVARNMTLAQLAKFLPLTNQAGTMVDRPVIDRTGISGAFDITIEYTPELSAPLPPGADFTPDPTGPTFLEALQEQLGLKLEPTTGPIDVIVVDHVEEPSPN